MGLSDKQRGIRRQCDADAAPKTFALWQEIYAEHRIPTFPVRVNKVPAIKGYNKVGLCGSEQLALKFTDADGFGFMCGPNSMVSVGDVDSIKDRFLADFLAIHGRTPIIIRTASKKFHAWYKFNGERRRVRPWPDLPIDVLGRGGFVVAPPSKTERGQYQFIEGSLDDLDDLPVMQNLEADLYARPSRKIRQDASEKLASPMRGLREGDGRNKRLFQTIGPIAREVYAEHGTQDALFNVAMSHNHDSAQPMDIGEIRKIVGQVWKMTTENRNWIGQAHARNAARLHEIISFSGNVDAFGLLEYLRVTEGASSSFWIANGLAKKFGWGVERFANARQYLIDLGYLKQIKPAWSKSPACYMWASDAEGAQP